MTNRKCAAVGIAVLVLMCGFITVCLDRAILDEHLERTTAGLSLLPRAWPSYSPDAIDVRYPLMGAR